jgi:hypothetical protein
MDTNRRALLRRVAIGTGAAFALPVLGAPLARPVAADGPTVKVDADKKNVVRKPDQTFDPDDPPPGKPANEDAFTECLVNCDAKVPAGQAQAKVVGQDPQGRGCTIEVTVKSVEVTVGKTITVFMPPAPAADAPEAEKKAYAVLKAHEEGHAKICREVFEIAAKKLAEDVFKAFPKSFRLDVDPCTAEEVQKRTDAAVKALADGLCEQLIMKLHEVCEAAGKSYDAATANGTKGPKKGKPGETEPATVENQAAAADNAVQTFKKDFEKPKK